MEEEDLDDVFEDLGEVPPEPEHKVQQTQPQPTIAGPIITDDMFSKQLAAVMKAVKFQP